MPVVIMDTETTGMEDTDQVVELAAVSPEGQALTNILIRPTVPVHPSARAAHHITDRTLSTCDEAPSWAKTVEDLLALGTPVLHNADFDMRMIRQTWPGITIPPHICTYRLSLRLWPDAPSHSNQSLRYWLECEPPWLPPNVPPHRALPDACVTAALLQRMVLEYIIATDPPGVTPTILATLTEERRAAIYDTMVEHTLEPVVLHRVRFGKHQGQLWSEVPHDYLQWCMRQPDFDRDVMHTARHFLGAPPAPTTWCFTYSPQPDEKGADGCAEHTGQQVTLVRPLSHGMVLIRAADGWEGNAFRRELA